MTKVNTFTISWETGLSSEIIDELIKQTST